MESDGGMDTILKAFPVISIHALLWRATIEYLQGKIKAEISIHALLWRATKTQGSGCQEPGRFQSTLSYGERRRETTGEVCPIGISIHALLWRATEFCKKHCPNSDISIHALLWRATIKSGACTRQL